MAIETLFILGASNITVSDGAQLSGITQGTGEHLLGKTITLNNNNWETVSINDAPARDEANFTDNDASQRLNGTQTIDGVTYSDQMIVEAEYALTVTDPDGVEYRLVAFNIRETGSGLPNFATIEGFAFVGPTGGFPPIGVPLTVIQNFEFPSEPYINFAAPPCFTAGTVLRTPDGDRPVEDLAVDDWVDTLDHGPQQIRWIGVVRLPRPVLAQKPKFRPVLIRQDAFGPGQPRRDLRVSPQHRMLVTGWQAELMFGEPEILVPAIKMVNDKTVTVDHSCDDLAYFHVMFDQHEIVFAEGVVTESFLPGLDETAAVETQAELEALFPDGPCRKTKTARPCFSDKRTILLATS
ncbi:Hint domain-containing protein [Yoonia sp.]|uniref:Hint domain-containing protein n=1 Tax=Yoonia sp. TaxID=2212373 RepID=UPI0019F26297|nr:Hint domain-containing protein [Yoonia sp.]MBE0413364.1 Hint domain-containing protein [Yoonia sp.]